MLDFGGKPMIHRVVQAVKKIKVFDKIYVLTDSSQIVDALVGLPCQSIITSANCTSGTTRIISALDQIEGDLIINVQGDEPFVPKTYIESVINQLQNDKVEIATICHKIDNPEDLFDYNKVKVVFNKNHKVLYFSRQAIPGRRGHPV